VDDRLGFFNKFTKFTNLLLFEHDSLFKMFRKLLFGRLEAGCFKDIFFTFSERLDVGPLEFNTIE
jgi:hypothetical protein